MFCAHFRLGQPQTTANIGCKKGIFWFHLQPFYSDVLILCAVFVGNKLSRIQFKSDTTSKRLSVTQGTKRMHSMGHMNTPGRSHYMCPSQALHGQHSMVQEYKKPRLDQSTGHSFVKDMDPDSSNDF